MWTFRQSDGSMIGGAPKTIAFGYAGRDTGKNNPKMQNVKGIGPLPVGKYKIGQPYNHPTVGQYAIPLTPDPANQMFGRNSFFIHGDSKEHPGLASHGCIVLMRTMREKIIASGDTDLQVIA